MYARVTRVEPPKSIVSFEGLLAKSLRLTIAARAPAAAARLVEGLPFVEISRDEIYEIRLINNSPLEAAVQITIDGLSTFAFSEVRHQDVDGIVVSGLVRELCEVGLVRQACSQRRLDVRHQQRGAHALA